MTRRQPLDQELIRSVLEYKNDIGSLVWLKTVSFRAKKGDIAGTIDSYGYRKLTIRGTQLIAARVVWFLCNGEDIIDKVFYYKNRNLQDIRIENLEVVSRKELADKRIYK